MTELTQQSFSNEAFEAFIESRQEPAWLADLRRDAWQTFTELDWPSPKHEEWLRTDLRMFRLDRYSLPDPSGMATTDIQPVLNQDVELAGSAADHDSLPVQHELLPRIAEKGVIFGSLAEMASNHGDLVRKHLLTRALRPDLDRFAALNAACWSGGTFLYVPRGVSVELPLHCLSTISDGGTDLSHLLVVLEDGADATLLSECSGVGGGLHCGGVELIVGSGASLRFVQLQDWGQQTWHFSHQKAILASDASLQWTIAALGSRLAKVNQHVGLQGPGANTQVNGVLFTEGKQHLSYHTLQHHEAPNCRSDFLYKSALQDKSRTVWRGMIKVDPAAQKTDGYQRNDNLLLSDSARADSIPGLEIEADDVRCTHGSTSGRVDDELIFYAQCRGFTRNEAVRAIVSGFFQQIFDRITIESVREALGRAIARRVRDYD